MNKDSKGKIFKPVKIFSDSKQTPFKWGDIKHLQLEDDDELNFSFVEPYYSENNSWDGYFEGVVTRQVLETDEQYEKRIKENKELSEGLKKRRYETYLKLKREFESTENLEK